MTKGITMTPSKRHDVEFL
ncbi:hypothetical protein OSB04_012641 [Centaurea solstitialis]|uniref:Uncharacterized protein n=1 Tax=Centaurea solstitialis TaxID=347529 RepID=A0AA38TUT3_9ASTR|nr:hypothetical protein OSB04_012641 [Centaurea solstitialis]